jgi:L-alanine-DL-glutamate epimerase-like enolase superfamily enzyme
LLEQNIYFIEQPLPQSDLAGAIELRKHLKIPLVADESVYSVEDAINLHTLRAADVFSIYIGKAGGIGPARAIARFAESVNIPCTIGSNLEMGIGSAAMTHLGLAARAIDSDRYPCDIIGPFFYEDDVVKEPLSIKPGSARATDKPGLGVELDDAKVEKYRVR